jgi:DNA-binding response OmpR family regulator
MITARHDERVRAEARRSGVASYLTKPFSEGELLEGVRSALALRGVK